MTPTFFAALVLVVGLFASRVAAIYWQVLFCLFGAAAAVSLPALGGAVITPSVLFLPFLATRAMSEQFARGYSRRVPTAGMWLALAVFYGVLGAIFFPRIFAGETEIITMDRSGGASEIVFLPLRPVSGNITQSCYALGHLVAFLSMRALLEAPGRLQQLRDAILLLASLDCFAAALNLAEHHLGFPPVLSYVRNAYALFDAYEVGSTGLMRIHGTFTETSAFSAFSLPLLAFTFSLWLHKVRPLYSGSAAAMLLMFLLLSTSTTAYAGLVMYGVMLGFLLTYRGYVRGTVPRIGLLVSGGLLAIVLAASPFVLEAEIARRVEGVFAITIMNKMGSASGIERGQWNLQAWINFVESYGLGVGLGSARASSLALVLLSNLGAIGTLFFLAFLKRVLTGAVAVVGTTTEAARQAVLASIAASLVSCTVFDLGVAFYVYAAAASLVTARAPEPHFVPRPTHRRVEQYR